MATIQSSIQIGNLTMQMTQINVVFNHLNSTVQQSATMIDTLANKIGDLGKQMLTLENAKIVIGLSDDMATTQGRLELMNDAYQKQALEAGVVNTALTSTSALQDMIFDSAQRTFGSYQTTADMVNQLGTAASGAFSSPAEIVAFTEQMNKTMAVAGAPPEAMSSVTQAMTSGTMDSAGLNNLAKQAPAVIGNIQNYLEDVMNIDASNLKQLATEGIITADVIKNAMFYAAEDTNAAFASMPATWGGIWQNIKTGALEAFSPVLLKINEVANSERIKQMVTGIGGALQLVAGWAMMLMDLLIAGGNFIYDNWSLIAPVIGTIAAAIMTYVAALGVLKMAEMISAFWKVINTTATLIYAAAMGAGTGSTWSMVAAAWGLNSALAANPIFIIIMAVVLLIGIFYAAIAAINYFAGTSISATGVIAGAFMVLGASIYNRIAYIWNIIAALVEFFANVWTNPMYSVKKLFYNLAVNVLEQLIAMTKGWDGFATSFVNAIIKAVNFAIGAWNKFINLLPEGIAAEIGLGKGELITERESITSDLIKIKDLLGKGIGEPPADYWEAPKMQMKSLGDSYKKGYNWGSNFFSSNKEEPPEELPAYGPVEQSLAFGDQLNKGNEHSKQIADNTGAMANGVAMMNEDLQYMRDIAEREAINRYTTAEVIVDARSENHINSELDIDGVIDRFGQKVEEVAVGLAESGGVSLV